MFCQLLCEDHASVVHLIYVPGGPILKDNKIPQVLDRLRNDNIGGTRLFMSADIHGFHGYFYILLHSLFFIQILIQILQFIRGSIVMQLQHPVIFLNLRILNIRNMYYGIPQAKAHNHQSHTAPNAKNRHEKALLIAK